MLIYYNAIQQIKPIFVNGSQGVYGLPYFFNGKLILSLFNACLSYLYMYICIPSGTIIRDTQASSKTCISLPIFIGVIVGIVLFAAFVLILIIISLSFTCKKRKEKLHARNALSNLDYGKSKY